MNWRRIGGQLLSSYLLIWVPGTFAAELLMTLPSFGVRGRWARLELAVHGLGAMTCAVAGRMLRIESPSAPVMATAAIAIRTAISLQSLFWTVLPRDVAPGMRLPLALLACVTAIVWLAVIRSISRR
jgi:hypothetical protein